VREFAWNAVQKLLRVDAQTVIQIRNNSSGSLNTQKSCQFLMILRSLTLTNSSTFSPSNSKMSHFVKKSRKFK